MQDMHIANRINRLQIRRLMFVMSDFLQYKNYVVRPRGLEPRSVA